MHKDHHTTGTVGGDWGSGDLEPYGPGDFMHGPRILLIGIFVEAPPDYISHGRFKTPGAALGPIDPTAPGCRDATVAPAWDPNQDRDYVQVEVFLPSRPGQSELWTVPADLYWQRPDGAAEPRFPWEIESAFLSEPQDQRGPLPSPSGHQHGGGLDATLPFQVCPPPPTDGEFVPVPFPASTPEGLWDPGGVPPVPFPAFNPLGIWEPGELTLAPGRPVPESPEFGVGVLPPLILFGDGNLIL